ncbi:hypothetical protein FH972_000564 [Carpinus fangiana]|uniref:EF-hand domain-containing protein n=1 Tax=Carpinus fangiana TaxID=176857 RepID=A0A5N6Q973_9ROSI|nr:hypothetical protein FH972_000564 [Carpinus fangiana]
MSRVFLILLSILLITHLGESRSLGKNSSLISDGIHHGSHSPELEVLDFKATTVTCEPIYGFLPCTTEVWGQLFMIVIYEVLLSMAGTYVSNGSNLFFQTFGTGVFGASLFQILGTIPQVVLVLGYGVSTDVETYYTARLMIVSMIPFLLLQLTKVLNSSSGTRIVVLVSLLVTLSFLFVYCTYQVFQPWIQSRRLEYLLRKYVQKNLLPSLRTAGGRPNLTRIKELFHKIDQNNDNYISPKELRALILGIQIEGVNMDDLEEKLMKEFDISGDSNVTETEFTHGISKWLSESQNSAIDQDQDRPKFFRSISKKTSEEQKSLVAQKKQTKSTDKRWLNYVKAGFLIVLGTAITIVLAQPLMETLQDFSSAVNISSFMVSYVVIPFAMNYRQVLSTIISAREKTEKAISLTFSEVLIDRFIMKYS